MRSQQLHWNMSLIMEDGNVQVVLLLRQENITSLRSCNVISGILKEFDSRHCMSRVFGAEEAAFRGMRVDAKNGHFGLCNA